MAKLEITSVYELGETVFLKVRAERCAGMITGIIVRQSGLVYAVTWQDGNEKWHYGLELTSEFVPSFE
jgi:hypothetical protein